MVTHPTTNRPACGLSTAERTGSPVFHTLWSYVLAFLFKGEYIPDFGTSKGCRLSVSREMASQLLCLGFIFYLYAFGPFRLSSKLKAPHCRRSLVCLLACHLTLQLHLLLLNLHFLLDHHHPLHNLSWDRSDLSGCSAKQRFRCLPRLTYHPKNNLPTKSYHRGSSIATTALSYGHDPVLLAVTTT